MSVTPIEELIGWRRTADGAMWQEGGGAFGGAVFRRASVDHLVAWLDEQAREWHLFRPEGRTWYVETELDGWRYVAEGGTIRAALAAAVRDLAR